MINLILDCFAKISEKVKFDKNVEEIAKFMREVQD